MQETKEENQLIDAVASLLIYICKDNKELADLENEMRTSPYNMLKLHSTYCKKKAEVVTSFLDTLKGGNGDSSRH